jgi:hypothetical protein
MVTLDDDISAALVIRVWVEGGTEHFRGRLTTADTSGASTGEGELTIALASSTGDLMDAVGKWLDDFLRQASEPIDSQ